MTKRGRPIGFLKESPTDYKNIAQKHYYRNREKILEKRRLAYALKKVPQIVVTETVCEDGSA